MLPLGSVAFPTVGIKGCVGAAVIRGLRPVAVATKGVRPDIGVKVASPAADMGIGVNMPMFVPGIMDMLGTELIPTTHPTHTCGRHSLKINVVDLQESLQWSNSCVFDR